MTEIRWPQRFGIGLLGMILVTVVLRPADSVAVEAGGALWLLPLAVVAWLSSWLGKTGERLPMTFWRSELFELGCWIWVGWLGLAVFSVDGNGNVREAVNEWWWWVTAVLIVNATRRLTAGRFATPVMVLLIGLTVGSSIFAAHQQWISLPADRAMYETDPEGVLARAGINAPNGSPSRALFEARLYGGGVTGTFALANSLAGLLVLGCPLLIGSMLGRQRNGFKSVPVWLGGVGVLFVLLALIWTDSRSAFVSLLFGLAVVAVAACCRRYHIASAKWWWLAFFVFSSAMVFVFAKMISIWGLVPRTLLFRFQYWNATLSMLSDSPWFGVGPGNYQQRYGAYRLDEASETIADPHNWLMELLGLGGYPALLLFFLIVVFGVFQLRNSRSKVMERTTSSLPMRLVGAGGSIGFFAIVGYWISALSMPDFDATALMLVATVVVYAGLSLGMKAVWFEDTSWIWLVGSFSGLALHLFVSGGFSVPGVAIPGLAVVGCLLGKAELGAGQGRGAERGRIRVIAAVAISLCLLLGWNWSAWEPTSIAESKMAEGKQALEQRQPRQAIEAFGEAGEADTWDPMPWVQQSEGLMWMMVTANDAGSADRIRDEHARAVETMIERSPLSGSLRKLAANQFLTLYQRFGYAEDIKQARAMLILCLELAPNEIDAVAQLATVERTLGNRAEFLRLRERAEYLSLAGGHAERSLDVVSVLRVEVFGITNVAQIPVRAPAADVFGEPVAEETTEP